MSYPTFSTDRGKLLAPITATIHAKALQCTDYLGRTYIRKTPTAMRKKYISYNTDVAISCLVFDIDEQGAELAWQDVNLPPPNFATVNPQNGHAHLVYLLKNPVYIGSRANPKPIQYLHAIRQAMTDKLGADKAYNNHLTKNPLHPDWRTIIYTDKPYTLSELADWVHLRLREPNIYKLINTDTQDETEYFWGRNCGVFDYVRKWAYSNVQHYPNSTAFYDQIYRITNARNNSLDAPLPLNEVASIAKSITKWTWRNRAKFAHRRDFIRVPTKWESVKEKDFKKRQSKKVQIANQYANACGLGGQARSATYDPKRQQAQALYTQGKTYADIAKELGVSRRTIINWSKSW